MKEDYLILHDSYGKLILRATRSSKRLYKIKLKVCKRKSLTSRHEESWKCHGSFVKINNIEIALKIRKDKRIPEIEGKEKSCDCCLVEKQNRRAYPKRIQFGEILYEPISPSIHDQNRYGFDLRVDKSNYLWNLSLKEKSKVFEKLKGIRVMDEKEVGSIVKGQELSSKPKGKGFSTRFVVRCDETTNLKFEQGEDDITIKQETFFRMIKEVILDMSYSKREVKEIRLELFICQDESRADATTLQRKIRAATKEAKRACWLHDSMYEITSKMLNVMSGENDNEKLVFGEKQRTNVLTEGLAQLGYDEMSEHLGVNDIEENDFKLKGENVEISLKTKA